MLSTQKRFQINQKSYNYITKPFNPSYLNQWRQILSDKQLLIFWDIHKSCQYICTILSSLSKVQSDFFRSPFSNFIDIIYGRPHYINESSFNIQHTANKWDKILYGWLLKLRKKLKQVAMLHMANFTLIELIFEECFVNTIILVGIEYVYSSNHVVQTSFTY